MENNINFTSRIVPVKIEDYSKYVSSIDRNNFVDFPWTLKQSKIAKDVFTKKICDCTSCLITNGQDAVLMHLNPTDSFNHYFNGVLCFLRNNIDLKDKNLQAVLVGSKDTKPSQDIWNKFVKLMDYLNIPSSRLKNGKSPTHIAYKTSKDEIIVSNKQIDKSLRNGESPKDSLINGFFEVKISECDEI